MGELAAASTLLDHRGKVVYLVPYRALAAQKTAEFRNIYEPYGIKVVFATGDEDTPESEFPAGDFSISTYEKLDAALRNVKTQPWVKDLAVVIVDEFHEIGEPKRGPHLEVLLMRLLEEARQVQLIALSATIGNPRELATWLSTLGTPVELILSDYCPAPLSYTIVVDPRKDLYIRKEVGATLEGSGQVLLLTATRKEAEQQAAALVETCQRFLTPIDEQRICGAIGPLDNIPGHNPVLTRVIRTGVAFHHAGLDKKERTVVETLFNARLIKVVCCTTTLAAGINTPARVVILRGVEMKKRARARDMENNSPTQSNPRSGLVFLQAGPRSCRFRRTKCSSCSAALAGRD